MMVKDLIHLLQTRCKPDDIVIFEAFVPAKSDKVGVMYGHPSGSFSDVYREDLEDDEGSPIEGGGEAHIDIGPCLVRNLLLRLDEIDLQKATGNALDEDGKARDTL